MFEKLRKFGLAYLPRRPLSEQPSGTQSTQPQRPSSTIAMAYHGCEMSLDRVPVTILTGFLGSGKTTLLNHILSASHGKKIAIIENEFGEVAIDDALLAKNSKYASDEEIIEVLNGCVCCTVRSDLIAILRKLGEFPEVVLQAARTREPHHVCYYARDLAGLWNPYVQDGKRHRVLSDDPVLTNARLGLALGVRIVLARALSLLGISQPERM